jgi:hypothetical protein
MAGFAVSTEAVSLMKGVVMPDLVSSATTSH